MRNLHRPLSTHMEDYSQRQNNVQQPGMVYPVCTALILPLSTDFVKTLVILSIFKET